MPTTKLVFNVAPNGRPSRPLEMEGHLFDARGGHLASAPVKEGTLTFEVDPRALKRASLFVSPLSPDAGPPTLASMRRLHAYRPPGTLTAGPVAVDLRIPEDLWRRWIFCVTRVVGRVVRPVSIGGEVHDLPVCHARVHVCEADPVLRIFERMPEPEILRVRDELLHLLEEPPRIRIPRPSPDPSPFGLSRLTIETRVPLRLAEGLHRGEPRMRVGAVASAPPTAEPFASLMSAAERLTLRDARALSGRDLGAVPVALALPADLRNSLASPSPAVIRRALVANTEVLMPTLCLWPWIWRFVRYDEVRTVTTDEHGRFEALVFYACSGDKPDIYCWVEYCIGGAWTAVLKPPAACATHWNYASGSELTLRVRDARVPWCEEPPSLPGKKVGVLTLGNSINVHQVDQATGLAPGGRPLGGSVEPTVWFGEQLQAGVGGTHYRWSYRRLNPDLSPAEGWLACDERTVGRHYGVIGSDGIIHFKSFKLGPDESIVGDSLFKIPPKNPPAGSWAPQLNARGNTASAYLVSGTRTEHQRIVNGPYELKLELFDTSGGAPVRVEGVDFQVPRADVAAPFPADSDVELVAAPSSYLIREAGKVVGFRMIVRIDNSECGAQIHETTVPGSSEECGFITYDPTGPSSATLGFAATHDNGFATFSFSVIRGRCSLGFAAAAGLVGTSPVGGYSLDTGGVYRRSFPVSALLVSLPPHCPDGCRNAAFAEHLHVSSLTTDGWGRLEYLDAHAVAAFALAQA